MKYITSDSNKKRLAQKIDNQLDFLEQEIVRIRRNLREGEEVGLLGAFQNTWNLFLLAGEYDTILQLSEEVL